MKIIVGISDARCTRDTQDTLITYSLGSCIGVTLYDPVAQVGGLLHYQLPTARADRDKGRRNPLMFADTGMEVLLEKMVALGANPKRLNVKIAGGAQIMDDAKIFNIGKRNYTIIRQILWKKGMFINGEDIGGTAPRTLSLEIRDGTVSVKSRGQIKTL